ncbi:MAG: hypothetical protein FJX42_09005, partial [Alphaproteobacteria bacterium]|nr:hypothetical protein [Alphaproteobacteria bacterium]
MSNGFLFAPSARAQKSPPPRLPDPLTPEGLKGLMRHPAYVNPRHPRLFDARATGRRESPGRPNARASRSGFEILYPGDAKYDATGRMIDAEPLPPHFVAKQVEQVNAEMAAMEGGGESLSGDGMVHVQSHSRDGGKVEVSDYWRNPPGQGGDDDSLSGQSGEDTLPPGGEPPKGAFVAADPGKLVRDWTGTRQGPNEAEKRECVGLVKAAVPEIGSTRTWREG